jgi:hypothetical protein
MIPRVTLPELQMPIPKFRFLEEKPTKEAFKEDIKQHILYNILNPNNISSHKDIVRLAMFKIKQLIDFYRNENMGDYIQEMLNHIKVFIRIDNRSFIGFIFTVQIKWPDGIVDEVSNQF